MMVNELSPSSFGEHMDHLAHHLITTERSRESENTLKLALSRILYMVGGITSHTQQQYFKSRQLDHFLKQALDCKPKLDPGFDDTMSEIYKAFLTKMDASPKEARIFLMKQRMEVLTENNEDSDLMKMLDILDYLVADAAPLPDSKSSELTWYRKTAYS
ncbi:uncharacterized protein EV154DRAFT_509742 [Mucor mucedo]|uniref:uncharacterized protein n=1 Tax=Mucor mucedo TaxID=29922 RepID=UPI00221FE551|nr:uncharacterized protein EV154DRAFT_509742 [Mucor mucedo]KAI7891019.1 hypothetical protein EV154DRAFT_509742 [Mucor mucedo]